MLLRLRVLLATQFLLPLAFGLVGLGNAHAQGVPNQGTWETTLLGRDITLNAVAAAATALTCLTISDATTFNYSREIVIDPLAVSLG